VDRIFDKNSKKRYRECISFYLNKKYMKKYLVIFVFVLSLFGAPKLAPAIGAIELMNFQDQMNGMVGSSFSVRVDFVYSGPYANSLEVSAVGLDQTTGGIKFGKINYGNDGINHIVLSGIPTSVYLGDNAFTLSITDKNGAVLTQPFRLTIKNPTFVFTDNSILPSAIVTINGKETRKIKYSYDGNDIIYFCIDSLSTDLQIDVNGLDKRCVLVSNGEVLLGLFPYKVGKYQIQATATFAGDKISKKVFTINVVPRGTTITTPKITPTTKKLTPTKTGTVSTQKTTLENQKSAETNNISDNSNLGTTTNKEQQTENFFYRLLKKILSWF
jgi:hypothetical protein